MDAQEEPQIAERLTHELDSIKAYKTYIKGHGKYGQTAKLAISHDNLLLALAVKWKDTHFDMTVPKDWMRERDAHQRTVFHYIGMLYGLESLSQVFGRLLGERDTRIDTKQIRTMLHSLDVNDMTPLHYAAFYRGELETNGQIQCLQRMNLDVWAKNAFGDEPVDIREASFAIDDAFYHACSSLRMAIGLETKNLFFRASRGDVNAIEAFIREHDSPVLLHFRDNNDMTMLHVAVKYGRIDAAIRLLEMGANINAIDRWGNTPLHYAVANTDKVLLLQNDEAAPELDEEHEYESKTKVFMFENGLRLVELLCQRQADRSHRNHEGKLPHEMAEYRSPAWNLVDWKTWRQRAKYEPGYLAVYVENYKAHCALWRDTLVGMDLDVAREHLDALRLGFHIVDSIDMDRYDTRGFAGYFAHCAVTVMEKQLEEFYPRRSLNPVKLARAAKSHHRDLHWHLDSQYYRLRQCRFDLVDDEDTPFITQFKLTGYNCLLSDVLGGKEGAFKRAKLTILKCNSNPNGLMMQYLNVVRLMILQCIKKEKQLEDHAEYRYGSPYNDGGW